MITSTQDYGFSVTNKYHLYVPDNPFSASELSAMSYHGYLRPQFGPYYVDSDMPDTASQRAKSVRMVGEQMIAGSWAATLMTAAWIHLGGQAPEIFQAAGVQHDRVRRYSRFMTTEVRQIDYLHRTDVSDDDLLVIGGIVVTGPALTVSDLLAVGGTGRHRDIATDLADRFRVTS